jgi:hypothetical protein
VLGIKLDCTPEPEYFEIEPEAWPAMEIFLACQTQWRMGLNGPIGLDYIAVSWLFKLYNIANPAAVLADMQIIESEILRVIYKKEA